MTDMEFHAKLPELPTQEELPLWITSPINEAVGFDRYAETDFADTDLNGLNLELMMLESKLSQFNSDVKDIDQASKEAQEAKERLAKFYENMALKVRRLEQRALNIKQSAQPKLNALEERKDMIEKAIRLREAAARQQAELDKMLAKFAEITAKMPWKDIAKPHQLEGAQRMTFNKSMILADDVGLGKTLTSIMTCAYIKAKTAEGDNDDPFAFALGNFNQPPSGRRILYLVPAALDTNIRKEYKKWTETNPVFLSKVNRNGRRIMLDALKEGKPDCVVIVNHEAWRRDKLLINDLIEMEFDTVIIDEAHMVKERKSIAYRGINHLIHTKDFVEEDKDSKDNGDCTYSPVMRKPDGSEYLKPRYVFPMTGTPVLNRPQELFTLLTLVDPVNFPATPAGESAYLRMYCQQDPWSGRWFFADGQLDKLAESISNLYLRRTLKDAGIKLPPQDIQYHELDIDEEEYPEQAQARQDMREYAALMLDPDSPVAMASNALVVRLRLRQIETLPSGIKFLRANDFGELVNDSFNVDESQKLDYIIKKNGGNEYSGLLMEVCPSQRTVIYSQFTEPLEELYRRATDAGLRAVILDGKTGKRYGDPRDLAEQIKIDVDRYYVEKNNSVYKYDVVLANYRVGGTGLNYTDFTQTIICDEEWNPGKRDQAYGRTNRMGQTEETTVHVIRMKQTIDNWMAELIAGKEDMVNKFNTKNALREALRKGEI